MCSPTFLKIFLYILFALIVFPTAVFATSPQITNYPTGAITLDNPFTLSATMSGLSKSTLYRLRVALAPQGTSNYFGSTWNGSYWYNGTPSPINYADFLSITTDSTGAWWGDIQGEIDANDPNFTIGSGAYDLKIGRYTQTGSSATWSDPMAATVTIPPQPTDTPILPTSTPTPIPTSSPIPTIKPIPTPTHSIGYTTPTIMISYGISTFGAVLGTSSAISPTGELPTLVAAVNETRKTEVNFIPFIFIILGFFLLASCGILIASQTEKGKGLWKKLL